MIDTARRDANERSEKRLKRPAAERTQHTQRKFVEKDRWATQAPRGSTATAKTAGWAGARGARIARSNVRWVQTSGSHYATVGKAKISLTASSNTSPACLQSLESLYPYVKLNFNVAEIRVLTLSGISHFPDPSASIHHISLTIPRPTWIFQIARVAMTRFKDSSEPNTHQMYLKALPSHPGRSERVSLPTCQNFIL